MYVGMNADIQDLLYHVMTVNDNYAIADSIYCKMLTDGNVPSLQIKALQAYNPLKSNHAGADLNKCRNFEGCTSLEDSLACYFIMMRAAIELDSTKNVISNLYGIIGLHNVMFTRLMSHSLLKVQADHESNKALKTERKLQEKKKAMWYIGVICVLLVGLMIFAARLISVRNRNKRLALEMNLRVLSDEMTQIKTELTKSQKECTSLHDEAATNADKLRRQSAIAFMSRFAWVEKLGNMYLDSDLTPNTPQALHRKVKEELSTVKLSSFKMELIDIVNAHRDNLITHIETRCPSLTKAEMDYIVLSCAGLSQRVIAFLLCKTVQSVYNLKSRVRTKIKTEAPDLLDEHCASSILIR